MEPSVLIMMTTTIGKYRHMMHSSTNGVFNIIAIDHRHIVERAHGRQGQQHGVLRHNAYSLTQ